jgi:predicted anti-sigma-YlaC factor YlaD
MIEKEESTEVTLLEVNVAFVKVIKSVIDGARLTEHLKHCEDCRNANNPMVALLIELAADFEAKIRGGVNTSDAVEALLQSDYGERMCVVQEYLQARGVSNVH